MYICMYICVCICVYIYIYIYIYIYTPVRVVCLYTCMYVWYAPRTGKFVKVAVAAGNHEPMQNLGFRLHASVYRHVHVCACAPHASVYVEVAGVDDGLYLSAKHIVIHP
jgi:hypothetical protein